MKHHISLKKYNTFRVEALAKNFIEINKESTLIEVYNQDTFQKPYFILGAGSNVLFTQDFDGTIVKINNKGIQHFIEGNNIYVTAAAGEIWNDLVWYCIEHNFPGLENMALIPGTVGASPVQNIGAYGTELMEIFYTCRAFDTYTGSLKTFSNSDCEFSYRDSIFKTKYKNRYIILSVTYKLNSNTAINTSYGAIENELRKRGIIKPNIKDIAEVVSHIRVEKLPDPSTIGNAGSFFKNPIVSSEIIEELKKSHPEIIYYPLKNSSYKIAAGWLIEYCGWKGKNIGNASVWKNQALVLTNTGNATGAEIFELSDQIIHDVYSKFNITLEREVNIL